MAEPPTALIENPFFPALAFILENNFLTGRTPFKVKLR